MHKLRTKNTLKQTMKIRTNEEALDKLNISTIDGMIGKTFTKIRLSEDELSFITDNNEFVRFFHDQDCCEYVTIEDINGELSDLLNTPILTAEEVSTCETAIRAIETDSHTWTFYRFATYKGVVIVRWLGESNSYYSESVNIEVNNFNK